jgi:RDD family
MTDQPPFGEPYQPPPPRPEGYSYPPPPPPSAGGYPPPPPSAGGYAPPPPGPVVRALPTDSYTPWFTRVRAFVIDAVPIIILQLVNQGIMSVSRESVIGALLGFVISLLILAYWVWNFGYRQGTTGSSIGKSVLKFKVVSEVTGQPLGFGMSLVRQIAHFVDAIICYIGYLFPLWDAKRQTIADKIMTTVCLPL